MVKTIKRDENRSLEQLKKKKSARQKKKSTREVLEEYKSGEREFHDLNLSGESFTKCNLSGADFTKCNLRGTNFRKARLQKAIFHGVEAGSENSQIEYTLFFISLLVFTFATIFTIFLLVHSRQTELDVIKKYSAGFLSLAVFVPVGYYIHQLQSGTMMSQGFWGIGILVFVLKTFDQPLFRVCGNLLFVVMALTLISPLYRLWRNTTKPRWYFLVNLINFLIFAILGLLAIIAVFIPFFPLELVFPLELDLLEDGRFLLTLSSCLFSLPAIFSLLFSLAAYSILFNSFDSSSGKTYVKIFNTFILILFLALAFSLYYFGIIGYLDFTTIYDFDEVFSQPKISYLAIFVLSIVILWLIRSVILTAKNYLKWLIWLIFSILFWSYLSYISQFDSVESLIGRFLYGDTYLGKIESLISRFLFVLILIVILAFVGAVVSLILWGVLLLVKSEIAESKYQVLPGQKIKSKYSGFRNLAVLARCLGGTDFVGANLTEADFSEAQLAGVNFRGARLKRALWSDAKGLEGAAVGNTYLQYPKIRNWVVRVKREAG